MTEMAKLSRNEKFLFGLILLASLVTFHKWVVSPWRLKTAALASRLAETGARIDADRKTYNELFLKASPSELKLRSQALIERLERSNDSFSNLVSKLTTETEAVPMELKRMAIGKSVSGTDYLKTPLDLDVEASFPSIGKFLEKLGDLPLLAEVDSIEIYRQENDLKKCSARIKLLGYVVKR